MRRIIQFNRELTKDNGYAGKDSMINI